MQQNNIGSRLCENQENRAETNILLLYKQVQNYMQMISNMTSQYMGMKYTWLWSGTNKNQGYRHYESKDIKQTTWHPKVSDFEKNRGGWQK